MGPSGDPVDNEYGTSMPKTAADPDIATSRVIRIAGYEFQHDLVVARLFYIFYFASFGSLFPLLAIYFKQLGMDALQAGLLLGIRPLIEFAARPFWSSFANKFRRVNSEYIFQLFTHILAIILQ